MRERRKGRVITVTSVAGLIGGPGTTLYGGPLDGREADHVDRHAKLRQLHGCRQACQASTDNDHTFIWHEESAPYCETLKGLRHSFGQLDEPKKIRSASLAFVSVFYRRIFLLFSRIASYSEPPSFRSRSHADGGINPQ